MSSRSQPGGWRAGGPARNAGNNRGHEWRRDPNAGKKPRHGLTRREKLALFGGGLVLLLALVVLVVWFLLPARPAAFVLVGEDYLSRLGDPLNAATAFDALDVCLDSDRNSFKTGKPVRAAANQSLVGDWTKDLSVKGEKVVVIYVDAVGAVDKDGAYLLAGNGQHVHVSRFLEDLHNKEDIRGKDKLVVFDATKVAAHGPTFVHNDFVAQLEKETEKTLQDDDKLLFMVSSDKGQRSWVSEEWRQSIFAQKFQEGLQGQADKLSESLLDRNTRVTALELFRYVHNEVKEWTRTNRGAEQTPLLLPAGEEGKRRADRMVLAQVDGNYVPIPPTEAPGAAFDVPAWLAEEWDKHETLRRAAPPPFTYAPHLWRRYQTQLLRAEAVFLVGRAREAEDLVRDAAKLRERVDEARHLKLGQAQGANFPLRGALTADDRDKARERLDALWDRPTPEAAAETRDWVNKELTRQKLLEVAFYEALVDRLLRETDDARFDGQLARAKAVLDALTLWQGNDRPTEALFVAMLTKHLAEPRPPAALVRQAIQLRRDAETAALSSRPVEGRPEVPPASERLLPTVRARVEEADALRRVAEDTLFSSLEADWKRAEGEFKRAKELYDAAARDAEETRVALWVCDKAYAELPFYGDWLARSRGEEIEGVLALWKAVHALEARVRPTTIAADDGGDRRALRVLAEDLRKGLSELEERFQKSCTGLGGGKTQENWHKATALLAVPFIDRERRVDLLKARRATSNFLNTEGKKGDADAAGSVDDIDAAAKRQGDVVLQALGKAYGNERNRDKGARYALTEKHLERKEWSLAGAMLADLQREAPTAIAEDDANARKGDATQAMERFALLERLCRQVDGGLAPADVNPVDTARRLRTHDLLVWLGRRTMRDLWWNEDGKATSPPYFQASAAALADGADGLLSGDESPVARARRDQAKELRKVLERVPRLAFRWGGGNGPLLVAGDPEIKLECDFETTPEEWQAFGADLLGRPVMRLTVAGADKLGEPKGNKERLAEWQRRRPRDLRGGGPSGPMPSLELENPHKLRLRAETTEVAVGEPPLPATLKAEGLFRGRTLEAVKDLEINPAAGSVVTSWPRPDIGGVRVFPSPKFRDDLRRGDGTIVIVLDLSESMLDRLERDNGRTKIDAARKALERVLAEVPDDTVVGAIVFSQREDLDNPGQFWDKGRRGFTDTEQTIQTVLKPDRLNDKLRDVLKGRLVALTPKWGTPLVHAMWRGKQMFDEAERLHPQHAKGNKRLLVLTDGDDNCFEKDADLQARTGARTIPKFMERVFDGQGIAVNIVVFQASQEDRNRARGKFEDAVRGLNPRGYYYDNGADNTEALTRTLIDALGLRPSFRVNRGPEEVAARNSPGRTDLDMGNTWHYFGADTYSIYTKSAPKQRQDLTLTAGDALVLWREPGRFRRALLTELPENEGQFVTRKDGSQTWQMTLISNEANPASGSQEAVVAVESLLKGDELTLVRPKAVWIEARPPGGAPPRGLLIGDDLVLPSAAWRVRLPKALESGELAAWVCDSTPPGEMLWPDNAAAHLDKPRKCVFDNGQEAEVRLTVDERYRVRLGDGKTSETPRACLVVRARYTGKEPVFAYYGGGRVATTDGFEHHFFPEANGGRYVGVFWFGTTDRGALLKRAEQLRLVSVAALKEAQETRKIPPLDMGKAQYGAPRRGHLDRTQEMFEEAARVSAGR